MFLYSIRPACLLSVLTLFTSLTPQAFYSQEADNIPNVTTVEPNKIIERRLTGAEKAHNYQFLATEGKLVNLVIEQTGIDVTAKLFDVDGRAITTFDLENRLRASEIIEFIAPRAGDYRLEVYPLAKNGAGRYSIRLADVRGATDQDKLLNESRVLSWQVDPLQRIGKYDEAYPLAARALEIGERVLGREHPYIAYLLDQVGYLQWRKGEYAKAEATLQQAVAMNEKLLGAEHPQTVASISRLGAVFQSIGDRAKAERLMLQAVEITEKTLGPDHPRIVVYLNDLGFLYSDKRDLMLSERFLKRALAVAEKVLEPNDRNFGIIFNNLGVHFLNVNDFDQARLFFERRLSIDETNGTTDTPGYSYTLQNLGIIAREKKDYPRALELYGRSLEIRERLLGPEHPNTLPLLNNIANIHRAKGDYAKALEIQLRVLAAAEKSLGRYHGMTLQSLGNIARIYAGQGDTQNAVKYQVHVDETLERLLALDLAVGSERQKRAYFDSLSERTDRTISLHSGLVPNDETARNLAMTVVLQRKGRVLDSMSESFASLRRRFNAEDQQLLDRLNATTTQLARISLNKPPTISAEEYAKQLKDLEDKKEKLESEISRRSAEFRVQSRPVTLEAVQAAIPANAALIEFTVYRPFDSKAESNSEAYGAPRYIAYVLRHRGEVQWKELGDAQAIDVAVTELRKALRDPASQDVYQIGRAADKKIMQPLRSLVGDATQLLISPDGELNLIPFEAFVDEEKKFLIESYSLQYLTSGRDLLRLKAARESRSRPLIIANPLFGDPAAEQITDLKLAAYGNRRPSITATRNLSGVYFAPLSGTEQEARSIKALFPDATLLTGREALEANLKQTKAPGIVHIATHGFFLEEGRPSEGPAQGASRSNGANSKTESPLLRSGLALAGANRRGPGNEDGILTALEASGLDLWGTKLVVLSACDTGVGEVKNGEGVYGLRRSFVLAGAESLVISLWPVSDYFTRELMVGYYKNLKQGFGRGESLRRVKLAMLKRPNRRHPLYWASFIQSGEWANLEGKR